MGYPKDLDEYSKFELSQELARRESQLHLGLCDYCGRPGLVEPSCKFPERHREAAMQQQRLNRIAAGIPQVGVTEVRFFNTEGTRSGRLPGINDVPTLDDQDRGRFQDSYPKPPGCGKTGCPKPGLNQVVGSLTYHACNDHVDEIQRLVDSE